MSPVSYIRMSSILIIIILLIFSALSGCIQANRPSGDNAVSDRLISFILTQKLPLGKPASPLRNDLQRCSHWIRKELTEDPTQHFQLNPGTNSIIAMKTSNSRILTPTLFQPLIQLNSFFQTNSAVDKKTFLPENIRHVMLKSESKAAVERMIEIDRSEDISETGGVVILDPKKNILRFFVIEPDNARWMRKLQEAESPKAFVHELKRIKPLLPYLSVRADRTIAILENKTNTDKKSQETINGFLDLFRFHSRYSYILDQGTQYAAIAEQNISGIYMGIFHVHPPDNQPSIEDKIGSLLRKNFVLIPVENGIEVHYLNFTADPSAKIEIIRWSHSTN
ncbi:hypothetical protein K8T06_05235 [bacterium]|nr:hypothetical protein [bacterium]